MTQRVRQNLSSPLVQRNVGDTCFVSFNYSTKLTLVVTLERRTKDIFDEYYFVSVKVELGGFLNAVLPMESVGFEQ